MKRKDRSGSKLGFCTRENRGGDSSDTSIIDLQSNRLQLNFNHQSSIKSRSPAQLFRLVSVFLYIYSCVCIYNCSCVCIFISLVWYDWLIGDLGLCGILVLVYISDTFWFLNFKRFGLLYMEDLIWLVINGKLQ